MTYSDMQIRVNNNNNTVYGSSVRYVGDGVKPKSIVMQPEKYTISLQESVSYNSYFTSEDVKRVMCSKLAEELMNSKDVEIIQEDTAFSKTYTVEVRIMPQEHSAFVCNTKVFKIKDEEFTEEEIEEALKSYFVDRFI